MSGLLVPLAFLALLAVVSGAKGFRARRRRAAHLAGRAVGFRLLLSGEQAPYPDKLVAGSVEVTDGRPVWTSRHADPVDLTGARPLRTETQVRSPRVRPGDAGLLAVLPDGARVRLVTHHSDLLLLQEILDGSTGVDPAPTPRQVHRRRRTVVPGWAIVMLGLIALWAAFWTWCWTTGVWVDVALVGPRDDVGECLGRWTNPHNGEGHAAAVTCGESWRPGDLVHALALPDPLDGEAGTYTDAVTIPVVIGGVALAGTLAGLIAFHRPRRRRPRTVAQRPAPRVDPPTLGLPALGLPALGEGEVGYARIAEVMTARAAVEGWSPGPTAGDPVAAPIADDLPRGWWRVPRLRRVGLTSLGGAMFPMLFAVMAALYGGAYWWTTGVLATGNTTVTDAIVEDYTGDDRFPFMPGDATVTFTADGGPARATVAALHWMEKGTKVEILYSRAHPGSARLEGDGDGLRRVVATTGAAATLLGGFALVRARRVHRAMRGIRRAYGEPGRPWRYVRFIDPEGSPGLMLFSVLDDGPPAYLLPLASLESQPGGLPVVGTVDVHGEIGDGATVVPVVGGRPLWPAGLAEIVPPEIVRDLVNGGLPAQRPRRPGR